MRQPPWFTRVVLSRWLGADAVSRSVLGDLGEEFADRVRVNARAARWWYRREALSVLAHAKTIARRGPAGDWLRLPHQRRFDEGDSMIRLLWKDVRESARSLAKQPRFTVVAALTLALGVGAVTAIFSVVNGILLQPLPFPQADRIVNVWSNAPTLGYDQFPLSPDLYFFYEQHNDVFEDMSLFQQQRVNLSGEGAPEVIDVLATTASYFPTLGVSFSMGRSYRLDEDLPDAPRVVVLSHRYWTERFGGDPAVLDRSIRLDGEPVQVVGIAPDWMDGTGAPDMYLPARLNRENPIVGAFGWNGLARLREGITPEVAATRLAPLVDRLMETAPPNYQAFIRDGQYRPLVHLMKEDVIGGVEQPLWILLGTVGMVLLIACANVANLFLIRAEARQREIAVRVALGASRFALVRKLLTEALVISAAGSGVGLLVSAAGLPALLHLAPATIPRLDRVGLDLNVVAFTVGIAIVSALLFGLVPALRYTRPRAVSALRHGGRGDTDAPSRRRGRTVLVVAQTAMALILLVGSGLLVRSFGRLAATDLGFDPTNVMTFRVALPNASYPDPADYVVFEEQLVARLLELPGIEAAGAATVLPVANGAPGSAHNVESRPTEPGALPPMVHYKVVTRGYFDAMGITLLRGRDFDSGDFRDDVYNVVINQALADQHWPGTDPLGQRLRPGGGGAPPAGTPPQPWYTVVGVVESVRQDGLRNPARGLVYYPVSRNVAGFSPRVLTYVVRGPAAAQTEPLRQAVWAMNRDLPVAVMRPMTDVVETSIVQFTFTMLTLGIAAGMALVLGAIGLYGVLAYTVTLRTREIGVRLALGAPPSRVMRSVVISGAAITAAGLVVGLAGAFGLTRFLEGILYETAPLDPLTFAGMSAALFVVALLASYLPARKAAAVSPMESMKGDGG
jgi:predicted permease